MNKLITECFSLEDVEPHHDRYPKQTCDLDLLSEIAMATACNQTQILEKDTGEEEQSEVKRGHLHDYKSI